MNPIYRTDQRRSVQLDTSPKLLPASHAPPPPSSTQPSSRTTYTKQTSSKSSIEIEPLQSKHVKTVPSLARRSIGCAHAVLNHIEKLHTDLCEIITTASYSFVDEIVSENYFDSSQNPQKKLNYCAKNIEALITELQTELQTGSKLNKDKIFKYLKRASDSQFTPNREAAIECFEIIHLCVENKKSTQEQLTTATRALENLEGMLKSEEHDALKNLEYRRAFALLLFEIRQKNNLHHLISTAEKFLAAHKLINGLKNTPALNQLLTASDSENAETAFNELNTQALEHIQESKLGEHFLFSPDGKSASQPPQTNGMGLVKELLCQHSLALLAQTPLQQIPHKELQKCLSLLSPLALQRLNKAVFDIKALTQEELRSVSHHLGFKISTKKFDALAQPLREVIETAYPNRQQMIQRATVLSAIEKASSDKNPAKALELDTPENRATKKQFGIFEPEGKDAPRKRLNAEQLLKSITNKSELREKAIDKLFFIFNWFSQAIEKNIALKRFASIESETLEFMVENGLVHASKQASLKQTDLQAKELALFHSLIKDMLIMVFPPPMKSFETKRQSRETRFVQSLPEMVTALKLLPQKKIELLIEAERGALMLTPLERASIHSINRLAKSTNSEPPISTSMQSDINLFDHQFKPSADALDQYLINIDEQKSS